MGRAVTPLAEKYSLRRSFRRIGLGVAVSGSLLEGETLKCRFGRTLAGLESRARHLKHMDVASSPLRVDRVGGRNILTNGNTIAFGLCQMNSISTLAGC